MDKDAERVILGNRRGVVGEGIALWEYGYLRIPAVSVAVGERLPGIALPRAFVAGVSWWAPIPRETSARVSRPVGRVVGRT